MTRRSTAPDLIRGLFAGVVISLVSTLSAVASPGLASSAALKRAESVCLRLLRDPSAEFPDNIRAITLEEAAEKPKRYLTGDPARDQRIVASFAKDTLVDGKAHIFFEMDPYWRKCVVLENIDDWQRLKDAVDEFYDGVATPMTEVLEAHRPVGPNRHYLRNHCGIFPEVEELPIVFRTLRMQPTDDADVIVITFARMRDCDELNRSQVMEIQ